MTTPITSFATLKAEMTLWGKRTDLASQYDSFIALCEQQMFRELKLRITEDTISGTAAETIAIPAGMGRIERLEVEQNGVQHTLDYTTPNGIEPMTVSTGWPSRYTVEDGAIRLIPAPSGGTYTLHYIPDLTPLSDANDTNWALLNAPDAYLAGSLEQLFHYAYNEVQAAKWHGIFKSALDAIKRVDEARRLPISGGLQIKPRNAR